MKKLLYVFLCIVMMCACLSIVACNTNDPVVPDNPSTPSGGSGSVEDPVVPDDPITPPEGSGSVQDPVVPDDPTTPEVYTPVVRFIVASDVHVRNDGDFESQERLAKLYDAAYSYSENSDIYSKLDGVFFCGDLTQNGNDNQNTIFFNTVNEKTKTGTISRAVLGNHDFRANGDNEENYPGGNINSDFKADSITARRFKEEWAGYDADGHITIGGYHFIFMSLDQYNYELGYYFREAKLEWLKGELDKALADDPTGEKPIFLFQHMPPRDTVCGSFSSGADPRLHNLLKNYPNVVDFSGHCHQAQANPESLWQGEYTALACGSMAYLSVHLYDDPSVTGGTGFVAPGSSGTGFVRQQNMEGAWSAAKSEDGTRNGNMVWMCELDANGALRLINFDYMRGEVYGEPIILDSFGNPEEFEYRYDREIEPDAPEFAETAEIVIQSNNYKKVDLTFPRVVSGHYVTNYRIDVVNAANEIVKTEYILSMDFFGNGRPDSYSLTLGGLDPSTTYTIKVYAISYLIEKSAPLSVDFTTSEKSTKAAPDILSVQFNTDGTVKDVVTGKTLELVDGSATPAIAFDETLGKNVVTLKKGSKYGTAGYKFYDFVDWAPTLTSGFTMEINVCPTSVPPDASPFRPLSWIESGGLGFSYMKTGGGQMRFYYYTSKTAKADVSIACAKNEWVHIVVTFDGSYLKLYKNGELVDTSAEITKPLHLPTAEYMGIGCDAKADGTLQNGFPGKMTTANIYSDCLTDEQVAEIYAPFASEAA